jgi:hypothetical protein
VTREVVVAVVVTLIVGDAARSARWSSARLARWAAGQLYAADRSRAAERAEEWEALISETIPSDISAFCFGAGLAATAAARAFTRQAAHAFSSTRRSVMRVPWIRQARRNALNRRSDEHRQVSLSLLATASRLRLLLTDPARRSPEHADGYLREIRRLAADAQLQAVHIAMLGPPRLAESAGRLAQAADDLADRAAAQAGDADAAEQADTGRLGEFDERTRDFQCAAVTVSHALSANPAAAFQGQASGE